MLLGRACAADQALLRFKSGPGASNVLLGAPTGFGLTMTSGLLRALVWQRLLLPLEVWKNQREWITKLDPYGWYRAACARSGRLRGVERTLARVCREVGVTVPRNAEFRDMNIDVAFNDEPAIEVFGSGLPLNFGSHLPVDIALTCALTAQELVAANAATMEGAALMAARTVQDRTYHEVVEGDRCQLIVVGLGD